MVVLGRLCVLHSLQIGNARKGNAAAVAEFVRDRRAPTRGDNFGGEGTGDVVAMCRRQARASERRRTLTKIKQLRLQLGGEIAMCWLHFQIFQGVRARSHPQGSRHTVPANDMDTGRGCC